jgi:hypothetical protein
VTASLDEQLEHIDVTIEGGKVQRRYVVESFIYIVAWVMNK